MPVHHSAADGFSRTADVYVRGRPDYPPQADLWLRDTIGLAPGKRVLDLGAGTGKFTARLVRTGAEVTAVEPVAAMREQFAKGLPQVPMLSGTAEAIPLSDAGLDAVVCAQAFHWFASPAALAEIRRVLKPGGRLGLIWNVRDESVDWVAALTGIMRPYESDAPRYAGGAWRRVFPAPGFTPLTETIFPHGHTGSPEHVVVDRVLSVSFIAALPESERKQVEAKVRALIADHPALAGRETVTLPYRTAAYSCARTGG